MVTLSHHIQSIRASPGDIVSSGALFSDYGDDPEMMLVIEEFLSGLPETVRRLQTAIVANDAASVRRIGHQMKGAGGGYGFDPLSDAGAALERAVDVSGQVDQSVMESADRFIALLLRARSTTPV